MTVMPDWHLAELAHAGDEHLDPDYVDRYAAKAGFEVLDRTYVPAAYGAFTCRRRGPR